jgi:uncharacterized protein YihD (DUF1040 family)
MRWAGHVSSTGSTINTYKISVRNSQRNTVILGTEHVWEDNIKTDLKEILY